jgi:hypothetical protein
MGCDYYIYTALKIVHNGGIEHVVLKEEKVYLPPGYDDSDDDIAVHPQRRLPKIDHMKVDCDDVLVYKKGESLNQSFIGAVRCSGAAIIEPHFKKYMTIAEEKIKSNLDEKYKSTSKYVIAMHHWGFHLDSGDFLKSMDDINEMYIIEARKWRP